MIKTENTGFGNIKLIQDHNEFCYGIDAVILADFAVSACGGFKKAADLGTGSGIIPFILDHKNGDGESSITGIDVQENMIELARESCAVNGLQSRISFECMDVTDIFTNDNIKGFGADIERADFDLVTCNPPYFERGSGLTNERRGKFVARHETSASLDDFIRAAACLLRRKGNFCMVQRPSRLVDIFCSCRKYSLEPKTIRFVSPAQGEIPNIVLVHCVAGGGKELRYMRELYVYDKNGDYSDEIKRIYERR